MSQSSLTEDTKNHTNKKNSMHKHYSSGHFFFHLSWTLLSLYMDLLVCFALNLSHMIIGLFALTTLPLGFDNYKVDLDSLSIPCFLAQLFFFFFFEQKWDCEFLNSLWFI